MTYEFINNAISQPDLQDAISFLDKPLNVIHELQNKLHKLAIKEKTNKYNLDVQLKVDKIINYYLPNIFNNYLNLSLEYRNKEILKTINNKKLTAKEILLNDLAKVTEEINLIEKEFNDTNKIHILANNRIISNIGYKKDLLADNKSNIEFENQFDYDNFIINNEIIFNKPENNSELNESDIFGELESLEDTNSLVLSEILLMLGVFLIIIFGIFATFNSIKETKNYQFNIAKISIINYEINSLYINQANYKGLNNNLLKSLNMIPAEFSIDKNNNIITKEEWKIKYSATNSNLFKLDISNVKRNSFCDKAINDLRTENIVVTCSQ